MTLAEKLEPTPETTQLDRERIRAARRRPPPQPVLTVLGGLERGRPIVPGREPTVIGREVRGGIRLEGSGLSREHARLEIDDTNGLVIADLGSTNGTFVNGVRVERALLVEGDRLQLGPEVELSVDYDDVKTVTLRLRHYEQSVRDDLTGLHNRRHFESAAKRELAYSRRHATPVAVIVMDLDRFKQINDTFGHHAGDQVLKHVAAILEDHFRTEDVVARVGGEEFAALLRASSLTGARSSAQRLRRRIEGAPVRWAGPRIEVTASFGVAAGAGAELTSLEALLAVADARLYAAKSAGRNRVG